MKARLLRLWELLSTSLWLVPSLLVALAVVLADVMVWLDRTALRGASRELPLIFQGGAGSAQTILAMIAGSAVTVMGLAFSITIVALQLASTQFTPRVLHAFTRDRVNQVVMGILTGTFTYAVLVQRTIRADGAAEFVPSFAVTLAILSALASVGALIAFIHHVAMSIQASSIIATIAEATLPLVDSVFPEGLGTPLPRPAGLEALDFAPVRSNASGYIEVIVGSDLLAVAIRQDVVLRMERGPGDFVAAGEPLVSVAPPARVTPELVAAVNRCYALGRVRTMQQDPEFGVRQMMDIAVKALSAAINDPTTAVTCIDYLSLVLRHAARLDDPSPWRGDAEGRLRLIALGPTFDSMLSHAFDQIRQHSAGDVAVTLRILEAFERIGSAVESDARRASLWYQLEMLASDADREIRGRYDRHAFDTQLERAAKVLGRDAGGLKLEK